MLRRAGSGAFAFLARTLGGCFEGVCDFCFSVIVAVGCRYFLGVIGALLWGLWKVCQGVYVGRCFVSGGGDLLVWKFTGVSWVQDMGVLLLGCWSSISVFGYLGEWDSH